MKIVLAYSGGLDTSVLLSWIKETYQAEMVAFCANIGQEEELKDVDDRIEYDNFYGLLVDYVDKKQAAIIIRGLRAVSDFDYEFQMALMNRRMKPHIETIFLMTGAAHFYTASRLVKEIALGYI